MKKILLATLIASTSTLLFGQITLENSYGNASDKGTLFATKLSTGYKYCWQNENQSVLKIYNLDHSLYKQINYPTIDSSYSNYIEYVSDKLFNTDDNIEMMVVYMLPGTESRTTSIIKEDGSVLFNVNQSPEGTSSEYGLKPIFSTPLGTKMLLSSYSEGKSFVYSLPGELPTTALNNSIEISFLTLRTTF